MYVGMACYKCLPDERRDDGKRYYGLWDIDLNKGTATCSNCGHVRPFKRRKASNKVTPSQARAIGLIRAYFDGSWLHSGDGKPTKDLARFEVTESKDGVLWVSVETSENVFLLQGGQFFVGPRGKIEVWNIYDLTDNKRGVARHYAKMLKGTVSKYL